ncbi:hypothetical protein EI94DRAFT_1752481 [Lactarius quietus]|nr:hypothetical protein EI94DRAFT_1752481 [Lactarius quietus]
MSTSTTTPANIIQQDEKNPRGIPKALFIVRLSAHAAPALRRSALSPSRRTTWRTETRLEEKIPEIKKTLSMEGKGASTEGDGDDADDLEDDLGDDESGKPAPIRTTFELADTLYAEAELEETDTVFLWLGANVMLSYKIPAAIDLLNLGNTIEDLEFIREQMTVMEVNTARVYNWDVKRRREKREKEGLTETAET